MTHASEQSPEHTEAGILVEEGLREAAAISHPVMRARHRMAWAFRMSALDPERAAEVLPELREDPDASLELLLAILQDRVRRGDPDLEPHLAQAFAAGRSADPDRQVRLLNALSEAGIELAEREREAGLRLLHSLEPEATALAVLGEDTAQAAALACALVGEALLGLDQSAGLRLLDTAESLAGSLPARDAVTVFLANALVEVQPERAARMAAGIEDPSTRLEARLQLAPKIEHRDLRLRMLSEAEPDAAMVAHMRGPEPLVRLGHVLAGTDLEAARGLFQQALDGAEGTGQLKSLQWTGVAAAAAPFDREWAGEIFQQAVEAALSEEEVVRRVTTLVVIADEMAASHPREAAEVFARAMEEAEHLEAVWEYAHTLDLVFRSDRSPYLDVSSAESLVRKALARISEEDPRIPGVFGLPEAAQMMLQIDPEQAAAALRRWFDASARSGDTDSMTQAALGITRADPDAGQEALRATHDVLLCRIDCPAMGEFARSAASAAPELVLSLAPHIPDRRERTDAITLGAVRLYETEPERSLSLIRGLERPVDRSSALLMLVDRLLDTSGRPQPQPLLEDLP